MRDQNEKNKEVSFSQKEDGMIINLFKICFWLPTGYYWFYSVCVVVNLIDRLINGPNPLPVSINPETLWLYYTAAYLVICAVHILNLRTVRFLTKK